jgi:hypothetical protein
MKLTVAVALLLLGAAHFANAQDAKGAVQTFFDHCLAEGPRFDHVAKKANEEKWPPLAADMAMAFTPVGAPTAIEGWMIGESTAQDFEALVVFKAEVSGKRIEGCTLALSGSDAKAFEKELTVRVGATGLGEETGQDTIYKKFQTKVAGRDVAVTLIIPRYPRGSDQVLVSAVAQILVEN